LRLYIIHDLPQCVLVVGCVVFVVFMNHLTIMSPTN
jgi:hypothetical protein